MKQLDFMNRLDIGIRTLSYAERREILVDYEEHFARGKEAGLSEEAICDSLGDPDAIARDYLDESANAHDDPEPQPRQNSDHRDNNTQTQTPYTPPPRHSYDMPDWSKALIAIAVIMINLLIVLPFWLSIAGTILGLIIAFAAIVIAGCASIALVTVHVLMVFVGVALVALGILGVIGMCFVAKYFAIATKAYLQMNGKLIREGRI